MTTLWSSDKTIISRLRLRSSGIDSLAAQLRVASLLNSADLQPVGLAPSAIVCIRQLRDPLPGKLSLQGYGLRPLMAWEQAVAAALSQLVRHAARPALGIVPANAEAVLFADRAELLACLASDWCEGSALHHWWWQSLFRSTDLGRAVFAAWLEAPEYVPAALQHLSERRMAVAFIRMVPDNDASTVLQSLIRSFALPELQTAFEEIPDDGHSAIRNEAKPAELPQIAARDTDMIQEEAPETQSPASRYILAISTPSSQPVAPWQRWVPESQDNIISVEKQCLLGIGLMLLRAPTVVRSRSFAQGVREWRRAIMTKREAPTATGQAYEGEAHSVDISTAQMTLSKSATPPPRPSDHLGKEITINPMPVANPKTDEVVHQSITPSAMRVMPVANALAVSKALETPITTAYGGIFYLINLGLFLNLYGDFTTPRQPGIELPIWDFLALLGEQFLGEKIKADAVWLLLAQLAGRSDEAPGKDFAPPDYWRLQAEWLAPFPEAGIWQWSADDGRLRVQHPEGFCVLDLPLEGDDPMSQLQHETQIYAGLATFELQPTLTHLDSTELALTNDPSAAPLARWLSWLMPYVRARLICALGVSDVDALIPILFAPHARVFVTTTHLDIVFSLDELPIAIRLAGLDRDPGWVPAAGRYIAFHYTCDA